ncbi:OmpA family protein [Pseudocolwellia sp. AS88]|uniref:OmpA family protein n=1 Tax=Pseudocolwellia sp. AS88 TaxID=3063958 RepID=UPI0026F1DC4E|nr:OmpA family protein [Pseudocolwellia sp. AS88]MDO7084655.1 OmpA family protein [Pseudocolwellia sp. AS88]
MKTSILRNAVAVAISSLFISTSALAEQPKAEDLVGTAYAGIHLYHIHTDNGRLLTSDPASEINNGDGFGGELGYRLSTTTELRLGYTHINLDSTKRGFDEPDSSSIALDVLYFPTEQNFYLVAGFSELDIVESELSANLGLGYRHYLSEKTAVYFETKAHYQFDEYYDDISAQIGFTYFFGDAKSTPAAAATKSPTMIDTDKDGVTDANDLCANTPVNAKVDATGCAVSMSDADKDGVADATDQCKDSPMEFKVDATGCTLYMEDEVSMNLLINFDNNNAVIKPKYFDKVKEVADFLKTYESVNVVIEGHASAPGDDSLNKVLSQLRADSVVNLLTSEYGIDADRLTAVGYGEERLLNTANTRAANIENRRIVANISVDKKTPVRR